MFFAWELRSIHHSIHLLSFLGCLVFLSTMYIAHSKNMTNSFCQEQLGSIKNVQKTCLILAWNWFAIFTLRKTFESFFQLFHEIHSWKLCLNSSQNLTHLKLKEKLSHDSFVMNYDFILRCKMSFLWQNLRAGRFHYHTLFWWFIMTSRW